MDRYRYRWRSVIRPCVRIIRDAPKGHRGQPCEDFRLQSTHYYAQTFKAQNS